jgi:hypothetical protein
MSSGNWGRQPEEIDLTIEDTTPFSHRSSTNLSQSVKPSSVEQGKRGNTGSSTGAGAASRILNSNDSGGRTKVQTKIDMFTVVRPSSPLSAPIIAWRENASNTRRKGGSPDVVDMIGPSSFKGDGSAIDYTDDEGDQLRLGDYVSVTCRLQAWKKYLPKVRVMCP